MTKKIVNHFVNFEDEIIENLKRKITNGYGKTISWAAIVTDYVTAKNFHREYFDFIDDEVEVSKIKKGDLLNLRYSERQSNKYSIVSDLYLVITELTETEVSYVLFHTVAKAHKYIIKNAIVN